jgi:putative ABC transport system substrate-binding protein
LVNLKCNVIVAASRYAFEAAMRATSTIPIVGIDLESDPVASGWVKSLARPGGNFTGLFLDLPELCGKEIELLKESVPALSHVGVLWDSIIGEVQFRATQTAAPAAGVTLHSLPIQNPQDFDAAFERRDRCRSGTGHPGGSCREPDTAGSGPDADQLSIGQRTSGGGRNAPSHRREVEL